MNALDRYDRTTWLVTSVLLALASAVATALIFVLATRG